MNRNREIVDYSTIQNEKYLYKNIIIKHDFYIIHNIIFNIKIK